MMGSCEPTTSLPFQLHFRSATLQPCGADNLSQDPRIAQSNTTTSAEHNLYRRLVAECPDLSVNRNLHLRSDAYCERDDATLSCLPRNHFRMSSTLQTNENTEMRLCLGLECASLAGETRPSCHFECAYSQLSSTFTILTPQLDSVKSKIHATCRFIFSQQLSDLLAEESRSSRQHAA